MRVIQIGNFRPPYSTENDLRLALMNTGHSVEPFQEDGPETFATLSRTGVLDEVGFVLWTRTGWDWDRIYPGGRRKANADQHAFLRQARSAGVPVVGYHLDIWWGLNREHEVMEEPFFHADLVITADGGHEDKWRSAGVNHVWMPPAVSADVGRPENRGRRREEFASKLAFVGSWQGGYHQEHQHRHELVDWLKRNFRRDCVFWPKQGEPAVRGQALNDLYASVDVVIGDSCFAGTGLARYWSDRIPETLGRGGFLLHPYVPGLEAQFTLPANNRAGEWWESTLMVTWEANNWDALGSAIEWALSHPEERRAIAEAGRAHVLTHHTYDERMKALTSLVAAVKGGA